jgi:hypothetical protein
MYVLLGTCQGIVEQLDFDLGRHLSHVSLAVPITLLRLSSPNSVESPGWNWVHPFVKGHSV